MCQGLLLALRIRPCNRFDHNQEQVDRFCEHLRLVNLRDHLAEELDALVKACRLDEDLWIEVHNLVKKGCKLGDDVNIDSVNESVLDAWLESLLHRLLYDELTKLFDYAADLLHDLLALWA